APAQPQDTTRSRCAFATWGRACPLRSSIEPSSRSSQPRRPARGSDCRSVAALWRRTEERFASRIFLKEAPNSSWNSLGQLVLRRATNIDAERQLPPPRTNWIEDAKPIDRR